MAGSLPVTTGLGNWTFQKTQIERNLDSAAYEAAHPDDTLVLAGPARSTLASTSTTPAPAAPAASGASSVPLLPIGMLQQISWQQQKPTQPMMAIGSGRTFFTSGKAQTSWVAVRLWVNGRNLLRVLYQNAVEAGIKVAGFDDPAAIAGEGATLSKHFMNLDSELFYLPFGMACVFRNKAHDWMGSFYAELCMITSWSVGANAGQSQILEQVTGVADRLLPWSLADAGVSSATSRDTVDKLIGFTNGSAATGAEKVTTVPANGPFSASGT